MSWTRVRDVNGFARWRQPRADGPWGHILANHTGIIVAVGGRIVCASTEAELEDALRRLFERLDWGVYRAALPAILEAWAHVETSPRTLRHHLAHLPLAEARG